jgi:hypothetical protein
VEEEEEEEEEEDIAIQTTVQAPLARPTVNLGLRV